MAISINRSIAPAPPGPGQQRTHRIVALTIAAIGFIASGGLAQPQALPSIEPQLVGFSPERLGRIADVIHRDIAAGSIPGAVLLIARQGKLGYFRAFGMRDADAGAPMATATIFRLASMTKPITIAAAMTLVEEGRLALEDPIAKYLPQFTNMQVGIERKDPASGEVWFDLVAAERQITVLDLMRHTSGFTYEALGEGPRVKELYRAAGIHSLDQTSAEMVDKLARLPLMYQPGTVWEYGRSIDVLGRILEVVSGMPLDDLLEQRILKPLHMNDTDFWVPAAKQDRLAAVFPAPAEGRREATTAPPKFISGGSGLFSTATDYSRLLQMFLNGGELDGVRVLSRSSVERMTTNELPPEIRTQGWSYYPGPGYGYGLGLAVRRTPGVSPQIGSVGDYFVEGLYGTFAFADPSKELLAVFMIQSQEWRYYRPVVKALVLQALVK